MGSAVRRVGFVDVTDGLVDLTGGLVGAAPGPATVCRGLCTRGRVSTSGSALLPVIPAEAGIHVLATDDSRPQVVPSGVGTFDQVYLPRPVPFLDPLLPLDGFGNVVVNLEVNEAMNSVTLREPFGEAAPMLPNSFDEVTCNPCVQGSVSPAGQDIDCGLLRHRDAFPGFPLSRE